MGTRWIAWLMVAWLALPLAAPSQLPSTSIPDMPAARADAPKRLPDGRLQSEAILKEELKHSLKDVNRILELADELKQELEKNSTNILSLSSIRKAEEIEKLAKRLKGRLRK